MVKNREIFIPNREIGRFSLFYPKSGDLPKNRETWKLCDHDDDVHVNHYHDDDDDDDDEGMIMMTMMLIR